MILAIGRKVFLINNYNPYLKAEPLTACPQCGGEIAHQHNVENFQTDLPPIEPEVTRFQFHKAYCSLCDNWVYSTHPEQQCTATGSAASHLGPRVIAFATDLKVRLGVPLRKIVDILAQQFGITVTASALVQGMEQLADKSVPTI